MLETIAFTALAATWMGCAFTALQLTAREDRRALLSLLAMVVAGILVLMTRTSPTGLGWIRSEALRSDALALGSLVPLLATATGTLLHRRVRTRAWALPTVAISSFSCAVASVCALAVGRSGWYWEFVATIVAGAMLTLVGALGATRASWNPDARIALGVAGAFGAFLAVGGILMLLAWRAIT